MCIRDRVSINVNGYYGWQNLTRFPKLANAGQYVRGLEMCIRDSLFAFDMRIFAI